MAKPKIRRIDWYRRETPTSFVVEAEVFLEFPIHQNGQYVSAKSFHKSARKEDFEGSYVSGGAEFDLLNLNLDTQISLWLKSLESKES